MDETALTKVLERTKHLMKECNLSLDHLRATTSEGQLQAILQGIEESAKYIIQLRRYICCKTV